MQLELSEEQALFSAEVQRFLERNYDFERRRASLAAPDGINPAVWSGLAELGVLALPYPETMGGLGTDALTLGLVMEACGRHLLIEPVLASTITAGIALAEGGSEEQIARWLAPAITGEARLALALEDMVGTTTRVHAGNGVVRLNGRKAFAPGAAAAHVLLVAAQDDLYLVPADRAGIGISPIRLLDGSQAAEITLDDVAAERLPHGTEALRTALDATLLAACWEAVGAMAAAHAQTMDYVRQRQQFGKPIAAFQVVQHTGAEMAVACEEARAACMLAALVPGSRTLLAARVKVARAAEAVAKNAVQLHGGMGVSDELAVASYFRKLTAFQVQYGSAETHLARYAAEVLAPRHHHSSAVL
ncbi:MAG: acyl-CoA dehydrogenase family protein [Novosphingobium sp.]